MQRKDTDFKKQAYGLWELMYNNAVKDQKHFRRANNSEHSALGTRWSLSGKQAWSDVSFREMKD